MAMRLSASSTSCSASSLAFTLDDSAIDNAGSKDDRSTMNDDLEAIASHPDFPFATWQTDDRAFALTALYWSRFVRHAIGPDADEWQPEFDIQRDGNPILTLTSRLRRRGVRVVLLAPLPDGDAGDDSDLAPRDLYACLNVGRLADGETEINELLLFARTGVALDVACTLIRLHGVDGSPPEDLEAAIAAYERAQSLHRTHHAG
jgi:hypothetical protein